jgi:5-methylcytosine-specific restriction endonuclease McrA
MARLKSVGSMIGAAGARIAPPVKLADPFYESREWRAMAAAVKRQRRYRCEDCGLDGRSQPWRIHCDHVLEIRDGGERLDPLNLQLLCHACHNAKTAKARAGRIGAGG